MPHDTPIPLTPMQPPTMTWIRDDVVNLTPPPQHSISILLREVGHDHRHTWYAIWAAAGHDDQIAASIEYRRNNKNTIRIDIPHGQPLSIDYLQMWLLAFWQLLPYTRPDDTPIIKH